MEESKRIDELILLGALEPEGIDSETGEVLYKFTDKLKSVDPQLHGLVNNIMSLLNDDELYTLKEIKRNLLTE